MTLFLHVLLNYLRVNCYHVLAYLYVSVLFVISILIFLYGVYWVFIIGAVIPESVSETTLITEEILASTNNSHYTGGSTGILSSVAGGSWVSVRLFNLILNLLRFNSGRGSSFSSQTTSEELYFPAMFIGATTEITSSIILLYYGLLCQITVVYCLCITYYLIMLEAPDISETGSTSGGSSHSRTSSASSTSSLSVESYSLSEESFLQHSLRHSNSGGSYNGTGYTPLSELSFLQSLPLGPLGPLIPSASNTPLTSYISSLVSEDMFNEEWVEELTNNLQSGILNVPGVINPTTPQSTVKWPGGTPK